MIVMAAITMVIGVGMFLFALGTTALLAPRQVHAFLLAFAGSPAKHYIELALRLLAGGAFILSAPHMPFSHGFSLFGVLLLGTTLILLAVPWRWHQRFARRMVPEALRRLTLVGASSLALGGFILWAVWRGNAV